MTPPVAAPVSVPGFWVSKVAGLLVGDTACALSVWLPAHAVIARRPSSFDTVAWKIAHTTLVHRTVVALEETGWRCTLESANYFKLIGKVASIAGKPDILARKDLVIKAVDCKTGTPQDKHVAQVAIYCLALPLAWKRPTLEPEGEVVYESHTVPVVWAQAVGYRARLFALMRALGSEDRPPARPSAAECRFCDVTVADCPARMDEAVTAAVTTEEF